MSSVTGRTTRQTRATATIISNASNESTMFNDFHVHLQSSGQFIELYNRSIQTISLRPVLINSLCQILSVILQSNEFDRKILIFILDCLRKHIEHVTDAQFKEHILPFIKHVFTDKYDDDTLLAMIQCFTHFVRHRSQILACTLAEWLSSIFHFLATHLSLSTYSIYADVLNELLDRVIDKFSPLSKDIVDVLARPSATILSTNFLQQFKHWIDQHDDLQFALFALRLWQSLMKLLGRWIIRGHSRGNQLLTIVEDGKLSFYTAQ
jgi:hypothetical protein